MTKKEIKLRLQDIALLCKAETEEIWLNLSELLVKLSYVREGLRSHQINNELSKEELISMLQQLKEIKQSFYCDYNKKIKSKNKLSDHAIKNYEVVLDVIRSTENVVKRMVALKEKEEILEAYKKRILEETAEGTINN